MIVHVLSIQLHCTFQLPITQLPITQLPITIRKSRMTPPVVRKPVFSHPFPDVWNIWRQRWVHLWSCTVWHSPPAPWLQLLSPTEGWSGRKEWLPPIKWSMVSPKSRSNLKRQSSSSFLLYRHQGKAIGSTGVNVQAPSRKYSVCIFFQTVRWSMPTTCE